MRHDTAVRLLVKHGAGVGEDSVSGWARLGDKTIWWIRTRSGFISDVTGYYSAFSWIKNILWKTWHPYSHYNGTRVKRFIEGTSCTKWQEQGRHLLYGPVAEDDLKISLRVIESGVVIAKTTHPDALMACEAVKADGMPLSLVVDHLIEAGLWDAKENT